jgi:hypothetical protein
VNRIEAIKAGLSKNYPMYWTGPRYQVPDADIRDLLAVAEMATHYPVCIDCAASRDQYGQLVHEPGCSVGALLMEVEG